MFAVTHNQGYHRCTLKNKHAEVRLPKSQKLVNAKALKIGEDQTKRSSRPQSPDFPLKIGEDQKKKKVLTSTDRGAMVKFEMGGPAESALEQSTKGGQAFIRRGQSLKLCTKTAVFKRANLLIGGATHVNWRGQALLAPLGPGPVQC